jgi:hypothetical protein
MSGAIVAIVLGSASLVYLIRVKSVGSGRLRSNAEKKLWKKWLIVCCLGFFFSLVLPGVAEISGVVPIGSVGGAGAILCFFIIVRSGHWYRQRLSKLRAQNPCEVNYPEFRPSANGLPGQKP